MAKWYAFEYDERDDVTVYDSFHDAKFHVDSQNLTRVAEGLYRHNRIWIGTKKALIKNGFENVRFVKA